MLVTVGGSEAIDIGLRAMCNPGDEVLIPQPSYVSYEPCAILAGATPVIIDLKAENEFRLTAEELEAAITDKTKVLILPFPNNPTGAIMEKSDLEAIAKIIEEHDIFVMSDEIYSELTYKEKHVSIISLPGMKERTVYINGFSKAYAMTRMETGILLRARSHYSADDEDPSVCHHVCSHHQPVCGSGSFEKRRSRHRGDAYGL